MSQCSGEQANRVPVVMSTVRSARRWTWIEGRSLGMDGRGMLIVTCLGLAVFVCFFAIGRASSPGRAPREERSPSLLVSSGGTAIPVRLSSAPPIEIGTAASARRSAQAVKVTVPVESVAAKAPEPTSEAPPVQAPQTRVLPAQPPAPPAPASSHEHSKGAAGAGKSFDSSG
jgi:hypothetical protein